MFKLGLFAENHFNMLPSENKVCHVMLC